MGYLRALSEHSIPAKKEYIIEGEATGNSGYTMTKQLLSYQNPPTAIHCMNEYLAAGAYIAINESELRIPQDILITAFDNLTTSNVLKPRLTTAAMPIKLMGETAADLLIRNILEGSKPVKQLITFPTELIIRDSTQKLNI